MDSSDSSKNSTSSNQTLDDNNSFLNNNNNAFSDSFLPNTIVQNLLSFRKTASNNSVEAEIFARRAIESLVKKLKDRRDFLDNLIVSITTKGIQETGCVCIARTLDGRLQVAGKKGFPHVIFAKIWRWPELSKNELRHLHLCQYPFDLKLDHVCVNPYHYDRIIPQNSYLPYFQTNNIITNTPCNVLGGSSDMIPFSNNQQSCPITMPSQSTTERNSCQPINYSVLNISNTSNCASEAYIPGNHASSDVCIPIQNDHTNSWSQTGVTSVENRVFQPLTHPNTQFNGNSVDSNQRLPWNDNSVGPSTQNIFPPPIGVAGNPPYVSQNISLPNAYSPLTQTAYDHWCTILYHEYEDRVGEAFKVPAGVNVVNIDGFVDINNHGGSRLSLGQFSNINRDDVCNRAIMHIGRGISLEQEKDNDYHISCNGITSVYMESYYLDDRINKPHGCVVHKIYPRAKLKCFDLASSCRTMNDILQKWSNGTYHTSPYHDEMHNQSMSSILLKHCTIRLSFVKGWGPDYPRKYIYHTPCWIEIIFTKAMAVMDELLRKYHIANNAPPTFPQPIYPKIGTSLNNVS